MENAKWEGDCLHFAFLILHFSFSIHALGAESLLIDASSLPGDFRPGQQLLANS